MNGMNEDCSVFSNTYRTLLPYVGGILAEVIPYNLISVNSTKRSSAAHTCKCNTHLKPGIVGNPF